MVNNGMQAVSSWYTLNYSELENLNILKLQDYFYQSYESSTDVTEALIVIGFHSNCIVWVRRSM
jgi:hypothetical protein